MAKLAGTRAIVNADGTMAVMLGGATLVDQSNVRPLELQSGVPATIGIVGRPDPLPRIEGSLGAMLTVINTDIPDVRARLDSLARGMVNGINHYHRSGWTAAGDALGNANWNPLNGPTGSMVDFFDAAGVSAATISLSAEVKADPTVIASGATQNGTGDNTVALQIGALRDSAGLAALSSSMGAAAFAAQVGLANGESYNDHFRQTVTNVGLDVRSTEADAQIHEVLASQALTRRESVSGVSIDEELTLLMRHQQAFTAASRLARVADEMAQSILEMV
jgi:flagellar hook-associated protein 1 FlgK